MAEKAAAKAKVETVSSKQLAQQLAEKHELSKKQANQIMGRDAGRSRVSRYERRGGGAEQVLVMVGYRRRLAGKSRDRQQSECANGGEDSHGRCWSPSHRASARTTDVSTCRAGIDQYFWSNRVFSSSETRVKPFLS